MSQTSDALLRDARPDERDALRWLTLSAYAQYATIMTPPAWAILGDAINAALATDEGAQRIVAESAGRIVGSVMLFPPAATAFGHVLLRAPRPEIRMLAVAPEARGLGIGKRLVNECIRRTRAAGAVSIGLHTSRSMREAVRLYESLGFKRDEAYDIHLEGAEEIDAYELTLGA